MIHTPMLEVHLHHSTVPNQDPRRWLDAADLAGTGGGTESIESCRMSTHSAKRGLMVGIEDYDARHPADLRNLESAPRNPTSPWESQWPNRRARHLDLGPPVCPCSTSCVS